MSPPRRPKASTRSTRKPRRSSTSSRAPNYPSRRSRGSSCRCSSQPPPRARPWSRSSTGGRRSPSRTTPAPPGTKRAADSRRAAQSRSPRETRIGSSMPPSTASTSRWTAAASGGRSSRSCPRSIGSAGSTNALRKAKLAAGDDHGRAADLDALDPLRGPVGAREEGRRPADLGALGDLDLVAEADPPVPRQVQRERSGRRTGRWVLRDPAPGGEHPRLPPRPGAGEAVDAEIRRQLERPQVGPEPRHLLRRAKRYIDVPHPVVIELDGELRLLDAERRKQRSLVLVWGDRRQRLLHPSEDEPVFLPLPPHGHDSTARLEPNLRRLQRRREDECGAKRRMARERNLGERREDADLRVAAGLRRKHEGRLREVDLAGECLHRPIVEAARIGEDRELVPGERPVGKDVHDDAAERLHGANSRFRRRLSPRERRLLRSLQTTAAGGKIGARFGVLSGSADLSAYDAKEELWTRGA